MDKRHLVRNTLLAVAAFYSASSMAAIDLTGATAAFTDGETAIAAIGVLALGMAVGIKVWKRLRGVA